jgi:polyhydroxybutyrate depolymerase
MKAEAAAAVLMLTIATAPACGQTVRANVTFTTQTPAGVRVGGTTAATAPTGDDAAPAPGSTASTAGADAAPASGAARSAPLPAAHRTARATAGCGEPARAGDSIGVLDDETGDRHYRLHVPRSYAPLSAMPLVLNFHGYAQDAEQQEEYSGLPAVADEAGFILVTPEGGGSPESWDIVGVYADEGRDDVGFVRRLVARLGEELCIDAGRVYATGHSNGAEMASELACFAPDLVAAVAPVSGAVFQDCDGAPVPMISFHGTADENVPFDESAADVEAWAAHNGCGSPPEEEQFSEHVRVQAWPGCRGNDVVLYVIDGGGHTWPGAPVPGGAGPAIDEVDAGRTMWSFFAAHPKP